MSIQDPPATSPDGTDKSYLPLGIFCVVVGIGAILIARDYPYGTLTEMGPGFIPTTIAALLTFMGILILVLRGKDLGPATADDEEQDTFPIAGMLRAMIMILGGIVMFALVLRTFGLALSVFLLVMVASYARRDAKFFPSVALGVALSVMSCVLFVLLLSVNVNIFPEAF